MPSSYGQRWDFLLSDDRSYHGVQKRIGRRIRSARTESERARQQARKEVIRQRRRPIQDRVPAVGLPDPKGETLSRESGRLLSVEELDFFALPLAEQDRLDRVREARSWRWALAAGRAIVLG